MFYLKCATFSFGFDIPFMLILSLNYCVVLFEFYSFLREKLHALLS